MDMSPYGAMKGKCTGCGNIGNACPWGPHNCIVGSPLESPTQAPVSALGLAVFSAGWLTGSAKPLVVAAETSTGIGSSPESDVPKEEGVVAICRAVSHG